MIDLHFHCLPGIDDGPKEWDAAVELCRAGNDPPPLFLRACAHRTTPAAPRLAVRDTGNADGGILASRRTSLAMPITRNPNTAAPPPTAAAFARSGCRNSSDWTTRRPR